MRLEIALNVRTAATDTLTPAFGATCLFQRLLRCFQLLAIEEKSGSNGMAVLQARYHANRARTRGAADRLVDRIFQGDLCCCHCGDLSLSYSEVIALCDRLDLCHFAARIVDEHLGKLAALCCLDRELEPALLDLEFSGDRLAFLFACRQALLQADLGGTKSLDQRLVTFIRVIICKDGVVAGEADQGRETKNYRAEDTCEHHSSSSHVNLHPATPRSLFGMDFRMASNGKRYHSGTISGGVTPGLAGIALSGLSRLFGW